MEEEVMVKEEIEYKIVREGRSMVKATFEVKGTVAWDSGA